MTSPTPAPADIPRSSEAVTERRSVEASLRASEERLAEDLRALSLLYKIGNHCAQNTNDFQQCLQTILEAATVVTETDKGTLQLYDEVSQSLVIMAQCGFKEPFLKFFASVQTHTAASCGVAFADGRRMLIDDVKTSEIFARTPSEPVMLAAGARACQSTPLISSRGNLLGVISTHFDHPHRPDDRQLRFIDLLARQTADFIERRRADEISSRLVAIVESCEDAIVGKDLNGIITSWNAGAEQLFGYTASETIGRPVTLLMPPERINEEPGILERIRGGQKVDHYETIRRRKDGTLLDISLSVSPVKDSTGKIIGASKIARDITDRKRFERQQQVFHELVAAISRAAALPEICQAAIEAVRRSQHADRVALLLYDEDGVMRFKAWHGLSEKYRRAVEGHSPWKSDDVDAQPICIDDVSKAGFDEHLRTVVEHEGIGALAFIPLVNQTRLLGKFMIYLDAPYRFTPEEIRPTQNIASQIVFAIDRQKSNEALERLVNERTSLLSDAIAQMEEFSYTVSHDLRAPLRGMQMHSEVLLQDFAKALPKNAKYSLERIDFNSRRLDKMVSDLLMFSRTARTDLKLESVAVEKLVRQIVEQYPGMQSPQADIRIDPLPDVLGHEPSLTQIFSNLLNNAVKFVAPKVTPKVRVWSERYDGQVRLCVADNGIGIDPKFHSRLFKMFERVHTDLNYEGTGVGLAIVRKAVERIGGTVGVESDGRNGTKFWIEVRATEQKA